MNDDFLHRRRRAPRPEAVDALWRSLQQQGEQEMIRSERKTGVRRLALAAAALLAIFALSFSPLMALADEVIQLFTRSDSDVRAVEGVVPAADAVTPGASGLEAVAAAAGYEIRVPAALPSGYVLEDARFDPQTETTEQGYSFSPLQGFVLLQQPVAAHEAAGAPPIGPAAALVSVPVGTATGQYVEGMWVSADDPAALPAGASYQGELTWQPLPMARTLSWVADGFVFTLTAMGDPADELGGVLLLDEMATIAESLVIYR